ncbi:hypothetical protein Tco_1375740 [Tanacetum coccineum]
MNDVTIIYSKPKAITPDLPIEEPDNSLSMVDEHLDTIPSVENLIPIPQVEARSGRVDIALLIQIIPMTLYEHPEFESLHFDPSFPHTPPELPDI